MSDELEARLRQMYRAVGDETDTAGTSMNADLTNITGGRTSQRPTKQLALLAASVAVIVVGGLLVLTGRQANAPAAPTPLIHVVPGYLPLVPNDDPADLRLRPPALRSIISSADQDRLEYSAGASTLTIEVWRGAPNASTSRVGDPIELPLGTGLLEVDGDSASVLLPFGSDAVAVVTTHGPFEPERDETHPVISVARHLLMLSSAEWASATATGGYYDGEALAEHRVGGVVLQIAGDLHKGFELRLESGVGVPPAWNTSDCWGSTTDNETVFVLAPADAEVVQLSSGDDSVEVSVEGFRGALATTRHDEIRIDPETSVDCEVIE